MTSAIVKKKVMIAQITGKKEKRIASSVDLHVGAVVRMSVIILSHRVVGNPTISHDVLTL